MIILCDYMKWDYHTYTSQPDWFIKLLKIKIRLDNNAKNRTSSSNRS